VTSIGSQLEKQAPTFSKTASARQNQKLSDTLTKDFNLSQPVIQQNIASQGVIDGIDFSQVSTMKPDAFQAFMNTLPAETLKKVREKSVGGLKIEQGKFVKLLEQGFNPFAITSMGR
jgi:hypothetical protein